MQGNERLTEKNDIKIFILYLLENINYPLDFDTINNIALHDEYVGYFEFADAFSELLDAGHIAEEESGPNILYRITPIGSQVASELQSALTVSLRERSLKSALRFLSFKKRDAKLSGRIETREDGKYDLFCSITEKNDPIMELHLVVDSLARAQKMKTNFSERPEVIYKGLLAIMACEVDYLFS